jgi:deoxyribodipyrimidine photo-lyase
MIFVYWFRKDLRTVDNNAFSHYIEHLKKHISESGNKFLLIFIKNKNSFNYFGGKRINFLNQTLTELKNNLKDYNLNLEIVEGSSAEIFKNLLKSDRVTVFANSQVEPYSRKRDNKVKEIIESSSGEFHLFPDTTVMEFGSVLKDDGTPYTVFTPFKKKFLSLLFENYYAKIQCDLQSLSEFSKKQFKLSPKNFKKYEPGNTENSFLKGGRKEGVSHLKSFYGEGMQPYKERRDFPAVKGTSLLSPHLHFGTVSIRECFRAAYKKLEASQDKTGTETWLSELIWREFYYQITYHFPHVIKKSFKPEYENILWENDSLLFQNWCEGKTGYPIVDAGMRQLVRDGWMHNRVRMITAMFLTKDLLIDWKWGEKFFAEHLIDLDFANNNGGWQWSASTGCDAQPYFRIFNPYLQSAKFDPEGIYLKKYVPELKNVPLQYIHNPSGMPPSVQKEINFKSGKDYPLPIVNHFEMKERAINLFKYSKR